jgi:hypothetical protein|tara:strand:+ start:129 stop:512 length:384 start_codon:yes stop_codon:yes gene_type:complete
MKLIKKTKVRKFKVGWDKKTTLKDVGSLYLNNDENITLKNSNNKKEYDICKKDWGFYGTPSLNKRLKKFGYRAALVKNIIFGTFGILIVDEEKKKDFLKYLKSQKMILLCWLDINNLKKIENLFLTK